MIKSKDESWGAFFLELVVLILIVLFIRFYIFQFFRVSGPSMCPTLNVISEECKGEPGSNGMKGEFIFVNEALYQFVDPKRGEIVVFKPPNKKTYYVKRVLGVPGDTVTIEEDGFIYLENQTEGIEKIKLPEDYLSSKNEGMAHMFASIKEFEVPEGSFLLIGDNRQHSLDSRKCFQTVGCGKSDSPFITKKNIVGRAEFVIWPFWLARWLDNKPYLEVLPDAETERTELSEA